MIAVFNTFLADLAQLCVPCEFFARFALLKMERKDRKEPQGTQEIKYM